jgi:DNA-binding LytR/AlgR family response regulator
MKQVLILEDNEIELQALRKAVQDIGGNIKVYSSRTYEDACVYALTERIDVFILDIILSTRQPGDVSGIRFAQRIRENESYLFTPIIFVTGLIDQELYAYKNLHSFGYLEKPFQLEEAKDLVKKALKFKSGAVDDQVIYLKKNGIILAVPLQKIMYIEAKKHRLYIFLESEVLDIPYLTIKKFLKDVPTWDFCQCSRSIVVGKRYIKNIDMMNRYINLTLSNIQLDIGAVYAKSVLQEFHYD